MSVWNASLAELLVLKMIQLLLAVGLFCRNLPRKDHFALRAVGGSLLSLVLAFFIPIAWGDDVVAGTIVFTSHMIIVAGLVWLVFKVDRYAILYVVAAGKAVMTLAGLLDTPLNYLYPDAFAYHGMFSENGLTFMLGVLLGMLIIYPAVYFLMGKKIKRLELKPKWRFIVWIGFIMVILIDIFFYLVNSRYIEKEAGLLANLFYVIFNFVINILILVLHYYIYSNSQMETELDSVNALWARAQTHYALSKETIDAINRKCHDLKHRVMALQQENSHIDLEDITKDIDIYDRRINTGNEVLDVVLTEKNLICADKNIRIEYMVDGSQLSFMDTTDTFVMFGNIMDNCIEAVEPLEEEERYILVNVLRNGGFILIHTTNHYKADLGWTEEGLPQTTKSDQKEHGFGMLSIETVVKRYNGELSIRAEDGIFELNIILPVPKSAE